MINLELGQSGGILNATKWEVVNTFDSLEQLRKHLKRVYKLNIKEYINTNDSLNYIILKINMDLLSNTWIKLSVVK